MWVDSLGSNKPVLPTATTWLDESPSGPLRRQTGQPLGNEATGQRATSSGLQKARLGPRPANDKRRTTNGRSNHVRADEATNAAASDDRPVLSGARGTVTSELAGTRNVPNKPLMTTTTNRLDHGFTSECRLRA